MFMLRGLIVGGSYVYDMEVVFRRRISFVEVLFYYVGSFLLLFFMLLVVLVYFVLCVFLCGF